MDKDFHESIIKLKEIDRRLAELYALHQKYEQEIQSIERRKYKTGAEEEKVKLLKFRKARGKERMFEIVSAYEKILGPNSTYNRAA